MATKWGSKAPGEQAIPTPILKRVLAHRPRRLQPNNLPSLTSNVQGFRARERRGLTKQTLKLNPLALAEVRGLMGMTAVPGLTRKLARR